LLLTLSFVFLSHLSHILKQFVGILIPYLVFLLLIGITLTTLWKRLEEREPCFSLKIDEQCKEYLWSSVISRYDGLSFFELETARPALAAVNRRRFVDPDTCVITEERCNVSYVITASSEIL